MANINEAVMEMVRSELQKNPSAGSKDLFEKAKKMNRAMGRLSLQQFHARYPLPVMRERAAKRKRRTKTASKGAAKATRGKRAGVKKAPARRTGPRRRSSPAAASPAAPRASAPTPQSSSRSAGSRANVQEVLLQFAGVVATADKADMVQLMLRMDSWVDRVIEAAG